jgi:competence protein ComFC
MRDLRVFVAALASARRLRKLCFRDPFDRGAPLPHLRQKLNSGGCTECLGETFHFDRAFACTLYDGAMKKLLHAYKFHNRTILKNFFSEVLSRFVSLHLDLGALDAVAAMPLDPERKNTRGFNQSALLCSSVAKKFKKTDLSPQLLRQRSPSTQSLLKKSERKSNVRGRFFVKDRGIFTGKNILLIDDILTTGQTASECARILKEAGARAVTVLVLARGA